MLQNRATLRHIRFHLLSELRQIYTENESEAITRMILDHIGYPLPATLLEPDLVPGPGVTGQINDIVKEIRTGKPIQYILEYTYFCDLKIFLNNHVLIPRPETEEMVERIKQEPPHQLKRIIDLGTGSGCIALALKSQFPDAEVWGVDISREALELAERNSRSNSLEIEWKQMDLLNMEPLDLFEQFDLVVSNPPYVKKSERQIMDYNVTGFEPESALFVEDTDPLIFYRVIAGFCIRHLVDKGEVWAEINECMGKETAFIFQKEGLNNVLILKDIHEKERYVHATR